VTDILAEVRAHLHERFVRAGITAQPDTASVTFLGTERIDVLRFGPSPDGVYHYVSLGCSRHPMFDPTEMVTDPLRGPRAEVVVALRGPSPAGLSRSVAILAAAPAVEALILEPDALVDLQSPLWQVTSPGRSAPAPGPAPFTAFLLGRSDIDDVPLAAPRPPVTVLSATPITGNEAAWVRLKGADAMREAWVQDGVDVLDPARRAARPS
jgi:Suppressor of fused protein (SUFU)